jgi:DNA polymerase III epsilon subunit family exonuclease
VSYLALDFETTGLYPAIHRVVEIGALRFRLGQDGEPIEEARFASLVDPGVPIPDDARAIHGISNADLSGAPPFSTVASALLTLAEGSVIVAHNASFDLSFLDAELGRLGMRRASGETVDTVVLARRAFPGLKSYKLGALASALGITPGLQHRALDDAWTCMHIYAVCTRRMSAPPERTA